MRLSQKQADFTKDVSVCLHWAIQWAARNGYYLVLEEAARLPQATWGHARSTHKSRLAVHFFLFSVQTGRFITNWTKYQPIGEFWKSLHPENRWGGDFTKGRSRRDAVHFSREHQGVA